MTSIPTSIEVNQLRCASIANRLDDNIRVEKLSDWAEGVTVFRVPNVLYLSNYQFPICNGFVPEEAINYEMHLDLQLNRSPGQILSDNPFINLEETERNDGEVCILGNIYSHVFTHWAEELLKVIALEKFGFRGPYIIPDWYPGFCHDSLGLLGISPPRIVSVTRSTLYKAAFFTTTISHWTIGKFPKLAFQLRDRLYESATTEVGIGDRLWVERGKHASGRDVINKEEIYACISRYGFVSVDFADHSFKKQIGIDREMAVMLGPHGSAFVHCSFMKMRQQVIEIFSPHFINPSVIRLCRVFEHDYNQIVPMHVDHAPYMFGEELMVDIEHLELVLSNLRTP